MHIETVIIGGGPAGLQQALIFEQNHIPYLILESSSQCASFFGKYPHTKKLISINKIHTGSTNSDFNLRHDWNSLLNADGATLGDYDTDLYPSSANLHRYLNNIALKFKLCIKFDARVTSIKHDANKTGYELSISDGTSISCSKLIVATGLSVPVYPSIDISPECDRSRLRHYADYPNGHFIDPAILASYQNKRVLIIGGGNASYELGNLLQNHCSNIIILGTNKKLACVSHYVGDIRSIYLPFIDTFHLKSQNGIDGRSKNDWSNFRIIPANTGQYSLINKLTKSTYYSKTQSLESFDEIIFCCGWKFDTSIFQFPVPTCINDKYPTITHKYESTSNPNLFFIGALMHSHDYKKGAGGFIHGFRYLIRLFSQLNYGATISRHIFKFTGNMQCYTSLSSHIFNRINTSSSLYQMFGVLCDVFYYDASTKSIVYIEDWKLNSISSLDIPSNVSNINTVILEYGAEETIISRLGSFNKWSPGFLHLNIYMYEYACESTTMIDRATFDEDLVADFTNNSIQDKITQTLKMCHLVL